MNRIWIPQAIVGVMLLWALNPENPYGYYILLRWVCCGVFGFLAFRSIANQTHGLSWIPGITALVYNPIFPVHLTRDIWSVIKIVTIGIEIMSIFRIPIQKSTNSKVTKE